MHRAARSSSDVDETGVVRREALAYALMTIGGYVDAVGYVTLFHLFTAHQSGNSDGFGVALSGGDWTTVWRRGTAIGAFVAGVALGTVLLELARRRRPARSGLVVALCELGGLVTAMGIGLASQPRQGVSPASTVADVAAAATLAGAMGLQNVILRRVGGHTVRTTFVTGVLTRMAEMLVLSGFRRGRDRQALRRSGAFLGCLWLAYLAGAVGGGAAGIAMRFAALAVPIAAVAAVAAWLAWMGHVPTEPTGSEVL